MSTEELPSIPGYTFIRLLGKGGMATVWEATQHSPERKVAIKILNKEVSSQDDDIENFFSEAKNAAALDHANIVTVFEVGCDKGRYYYVMELAAGYDVDKWLARRGKLSEDDVITIAESVAIALDYADRKSGIIHCDIKPANIMVDSDGTVRITDLGIARTTHKGSTTEAEISGTPAYMSPEQAQGKDDLDIRTDIYALGATMYHILSGERLFHPLNEEATMAAQQNSFVRDIRDINKNVSAPMAALISMMLAKDRAKRPQSWAFLLREIQRVREGMPPIGNIPHLGESTMRLHEAEESASSATTTPKSATDNAPPTPQHSQVATLRHAETTFYIKTAISGIIAFAITFFISKYLIIPFLF